MAKKILSDKKEILLMAIDIAEPLYNTGWCDYRVEVSKLREHLFKNFSGSEETIHHTLLELELDGYLCPVYKYEDKALFYYIKKSPDHKGKKIRIYRHKKFMQAELVINDRMYSFLSPRKIEVIGYSSFKMFDTKEEHGLLDQRIYELRFS